MMRSNQPQLLTRTHARTQTHTHRFWPFFGSGWGWFDLIIVIMSVVDTLYIWAGGGGTGLNVVRLLRIFR